MPIAPSPGDLVRISRDGVERATVPYDGVPSIDGAPPCIAPGRASFSGTFKHGVPAPQPFPSTGPHGGVLVDPYTALSVWRSGFRGTAAAESMSTQGDRWTATFPEPLAPGDGIGIWHAYTVATDVGVATVWSWRELRACLPTVPTLPMPEPPPPPPPPPTVVQTCADRIAADAAFETRLTRAVKRLRLRALRKGSARLVGRKRARVKVTIRIADADGGAVTWSCRVTLR